MDKKLESLVQHNLLTRCGKDWLTVALDPFHDQEITCAGYPDMDSSRSVVQCVTYTQTISSYQTTPTLNWDCHIPFVPLTFNWMNVYGGSNTPAPLYKGFIYPTGLLTGVVTGNSSVLLYPGYTAVALAAGIDLIAGQNGTTATSYSNCAFQSSFAEGNRRLVACGLEVVNTTAELNKQGAVTSYRTPSNICNIIVADPTGPRVGPAQNATLFPTNQAAAQSFPSAVTWGAIDGVYSIGTLNTISNPFTQSQPAIGLISQMQEFGNINTATGVNCWAPAIGSTVALTALTQSMIRQLPYDCHGCIFSGLSPSTTLQMTVRYYFELVPDYQDPVMLVMAKPSPCADQLAQQLYTRALEHLPVAVPVGENPLGEWFDTVMDIISGALPVVGAAFSPIFPPALAMGAAGSAAAQVAKAANAAERKKELAQQQVQQNTSNRSTIQIRRGREQSRPPPFRKQVQSTPPRRGRSRTPRVLNREIAAAAEEIYEDARANSRSSSRSRSRPRQR